jgi:5-methylcytosine-specific restriction endonuclease McrA
MELDLAYVYIDMPHHPQTNKISKLKVKEVRLSSHARGYDNAWRTVRKHHLQYNPMCYDCLSRGTYTAGKDVHHVAKLADNPHRRDDPTNLMTLCHSCHSKRTALGQ